MKVEASWGMDTVIILSYVILTFSNIVLCLRGEGQEDDANVNAERPNKQCSCHADPPPQPYML
jgi:hypothetical protein